MDQKIYNHLRKIATEKHRPTQEVFQYYAIERFLYRLSISPYSSQFFLKGGLMLMVWDPETHRPTIDIDLLSKTENTSQNLTQIIGKICRIKVENDGLIFFPETIQADTTQFDAKYSGLAIRFDAKLHKAKIRMRLDIGFSDKIVPSPATITYPTLLDSKPLKLRGYTPETTIAEKLDAMIRLGLTNSRMKDFYDIWTLTNQFQITPNQIAPLIRQVFQNRNTPPTFPSALTPAFYKNPQTLRQWNAFLTTIHADPIPLQDVIDKIKTLLLDAKQG